MADHDPVRDVLIAVLAWKRGAAPADRAMLEVAADAAVKEAGGARAALDALLADDTPTIADAPPVEGHVLLESLDALDLGGGRYTISRLHSQGGLGQVWLARDGALGREVAFKEIRPERADNPSVLDRFLREARITGLLEHPGIVPVYELSRRPDSGRPFYTMRFVRGRTLTEAVASFHAKRAAGTLSPLDLQALLTAFVGVANAVAYAHAQGVIHRDLKGDNVILGDFGETILLDWGLAKKLDEQDDPAADGETPAAPGQTAQGQVLGTPAYMAPEQASGHLHLVGIRSDVHGLGAILYEILTGRPPFTGKDTGEVLRRVVQEPPPRPRSIWPEAPAALEAICVKALSKDPEARYESAAAMADDVRRFMGDEPVLAWREPFGKRAGRWARRHRALVVAAGVLVATALLSLSVGTVLLNRKQKEIERQRAVAEANYRLAKGAVDRYLTSVAGSAELKAQGLETLRASLLGTAREFYETFMKDRAGDPAARADLGAASMNLGIIARQTGQTRTAETSFAQSIDLFEALAREHPGEVSYRTDLISAVGDLALVYSETGRVQEAEAAYRRAIALVESQPAVAGADAPYLEGLSNAYDNLGTLYARERRIQDAETAHLKGLEAREKLVALTPDNEAYRKLLLTSRVNLSNLYAVSGREADAIPHLTEAARIGEELVAAHPDDPEYQTALAATYNNLGGVDTLLGRMDDARAAHEKALSIRQKLVDAHPAAVEYRMFLAGSLVNMGELAARGGKADEALSFLGRADQELQTILAQEPRQAVARFYTAYASSWVARALDGSGRLADGEKAWSRAAEFNDQAYPTIPAGWAHALARRGRIAEAIQVASGVEAGQGLPGEVLYDLASAYAIAAGRDPAMLDAHGLHAVRLLEKAGEVGYFKVPGAKAATALDPDLAAIRSREDFRRLVSP